MQRLITAYKQGNLSQALNNARQDTIVKFSWHILSDDVSVENLRIILQSLNITNHGKLISRESDFFDKENTTPAFKDNLRKLLSIPEFQPSFLLDDYFYFDYFDILLDDHRFYSRDTLSLLMKLNIPQRIENYLNSESFTGTDLSIDFINRFKLHKYSLSLVLGHNKVNLPHIDNKLLSELSTDNYIRDALQKKLN